MEPGWTSDGNGLCLCKGRAARGHTEDNGKK
jgi:hypothetical protein